MVLIFPASASPVRLFQSETGASRADWLVRTWQTEDGLPENSATAMVQTPDGYLWFGTFNGLVRFDGVRCEVLNPENTPGLPDAAVVNLHLGASGKLWVSTYGGLAAFDGRQWTNVGLDKEVVRTFSERRDGGLLITTFTGGVFEFSAGQLKRLRDPPGATNHGYQGHVDEAGNWWVAQHGFVGRWNGHEWEETVPVRDFSPGKVGCGPARDGGMWLFSGNELRKYKRGIEVRRISVPSFEGSCWSLSEDWLGNVWICSSDQGLYVVPAHGKPQHWTRANGFPAAGSRFVFEDRERNLWVGTSGSGLMRWNQRQFYTFGSESGLDELVVHSVAPARAGGAWIATYGKGLFRLDDAGIRQVPIVDKVTQWRFAQSVLEDRGGIVWLGTFGGGLIRLREENVEQIEPRLSGGANVIALYEDSRGRIWIGGGESVSMFDGKQFATFADQNVPTGGVRAFQEDHEGTVWLSNLEGVFRFQNGVFSEVLDRSNRVQRITCLKAGYGSTMWMGSLNRGLFRWQNGQLSEIADFPLKSVYSIEQDEQGYLWMTSNTGVIRASEQELQRIAHPGEGRLSFRSFDLADGLATTQFTSECQPVAAHDAHGRLWLATVKGVAMINTRDFRLGAVKPRTHIEDVVFYEDSARKGTKVQAPFSGPIKIPAGHRRVEISYAGLSFAAPEKIRFETKLDGEHWEHVGNRRAGSYHGLGPGEYHFRVRATNNEGLTDEEGAGIAFIILPFFWQSAWFKICTSALLLSGGWAAAHYWARAANSRHRTARRMALATDVAHLGMWEWDISRNQVWMTGMCRELFELPPEAAITRDTLLEKTHPDDQSLVRDAMDSALKKGAFHVTYRLCSKDNGLRWIASSGLVDFSRAHKPIRVLGVCMDITEQRNAQDTARELSGRLIHAQEDERRRIARDLHDDLNQRLALLSVEMQLLCRTPAGSNEQLENQLQQVATHIAELSSDVHKLSYRLHPAKLDQLGLVAAARSFCRELSQQSTIGINFAADHVPRELPAEVALCFYRVMQESLQNMVRHSRAREANVQLKFEAGRLQLLLADSGTGFDIDKARRKGGLGLISMEERVRLIRGTIKINSQQGFGTEITVSVLLAPAQPSPAPPVSF